MRKLFYSEPMVHFNVRVQRKDSDKVKEVAERLGISEIEARREIISAGIKILTGAA